MGKNRILRIAVPVMVVLLGLVIYRYGYERMRGDLQTIREEQEVREQSLRKLMSFIARKPVLLDELASLRAKRASYDSMLVQGTTGSIAAAVLQEIIKGIVISHGGTIASERVLPVEDFEGLKRITVSIDSVVPNISALTDIIYAIETHVPHLVVREADMRLMNFGQPGDLQVKLDISALSSGK